MSEEHEGKSKMWVKNIDHFQCTHTWAFWPPCTIPIPAIHSLVCSNVAHLTVPLKYSLHHLSTSKSRWYIFWSLFHSTPEASDTTDHSFPHSLWHHSSLVSSHLLSHYFPCFCHKLPLLILPVFAQWSHPLLRFQKLLKADDSQLNILSIILSKTPDI